MKRGGSDPGSEPTKPATGRRPSSEPVAGNERAPVNRPGDPSAPVRRPSDPSVPVRRPSDPSAPIGRPSDPSAPSVPLRRPSDPSAPVRRPSQRQPVPRAASRDEPVARPRSWGLRLAHAAPWLLVALPGLYQVLLLVTAIAGRVLYPYDLEWMEGGMLHHALRIHNGEGIYVPPSIDFIPYLYTPLYPSLLALFGDAFGLGYTVGRVISIVGLVGIAIVAIVQLTNPRHEHAARGPVWAGIALAFGLFAAAYPYMEGWYDLVRADAFFLFMVTAGISGMLRWARGGDGVRGHARVAAGAALLALAFFCKQTGFVYVGLGGLIVLVVAWRRVPTYVATAGVIGLGGTWLLERTTDGWFWTYISKIHRAHDFNMDRFYKSFEHILFKFPAMTVVIGIALVVVLLTWIRERVVPRQTHPFLLWTATFVVSTVVGAIGWGTEFAHFNAYMPAFLHGALAAGAAIPAVYACWRLAYREHPAAHGVAAGASLALAGTLALACWHARWEPRKFIPTVDDVAAGDRLIARIRAIDGEVWMPSHPWYLHLAGKTPRVHRMGVKDVTVRQPRVVAGLDEAVRGHVFAAIVLDNRDLHLEQPVIQAHYRAALELPANERPRLYTGARIVPHAIWVPAIRATAPPGATVLFDFEQPLWGTWTRSGAAWGSGPVATPPPGHGLARGATGARFATSMNGGDASTGRLSSPLFPLDGSRLTLRLGGGTDATKLRVELWVQGGIIATASAPEPGGDTLRPVTLPIDDAHRGKQGRLVLVDDSPVGHLTLDDVWVWR